MSALAAAESRLRSSAAAGTSARATGLSRGAYLHAGGPSWSFRVRTSGRVVEIAARRSADDRPGGGVRGQITAFSGASRRRLLKAMAAVPWSSYLGGRKLLFVTLTYRDVPRDGRLVKRHLRRFAERWRRRYGQLLGAWKLEFQRRGAAHFHLALVVDEGEDLGEVRRWVSDAWWAAVGSGDQLHRSYGTNVQELRGNIAGYFAKYSASADKQYQHQAPEDFEGLGRWWGLWGVRPAWVEATVNKLTWCAVRRPLRQARATKMRRPGRSTGRLDGLWVMSREEDGWAGLLALYVLGELPRGEPPWARGRTARE